MLLTSYHGARGGSGVQFLISVEIEAYGDKVAVQVTYFTA